MVTIKLKKLDNAKDLPMPCYMTAGSSGMDICANIDSSVTVKPGEWTAISTGLFVSVPNGYELQIRPRSGLAAKHGVTILNSPGTIDSDYRGEIKVLLINHGKKDYRVNRGDRIAQMVLSTVPEIIIEETDSLPPSKRDDGGFGHTG